MIFIFSLYQSKLPIFCKQEGEKTDIIGVDWYDGSEGYVDPSAPSLAIGFSNGKIQIMRTEQDESTNSPRILLTSEPILIDTGLKTTKLKWNHSGSTLAIAGTQTGAVAKDDKETNAVQFYTPFGHVSKYFLLCLL